MKVVLFCGGMGLRLREFSESIPKPMTPLGDRPLVWHLMKYYAHFGHTDFILCLGHQGRLIREYFLNYDECLSNDFVLRSGGASVKLLASDIQDWSITFVDTGVSASIGQRLAAVAPHVAGEETFLANYSDGLSDFPLPDLIEYHRRKQALATFLAVRPKQSFHQVHLDEDGLVRDLCPIDSSNVWMNGGFFVLSGQIFDFLHEGEDLVAEPFRRLMDLGRLAAIQYDGYWGCIDTFKEKQQLDALVARGAPPWQVWRKPAPHAVLASEALAPLEAAGSASGGEPAPNRALRRRAR